MSADLPKLYLSRHGDTAWTDQQEVFRAGSVRKRRIA
jgi:hypothetical protein